MFRLSSVEIRFVLARRGVEMLRGVCFVKVLHRNDTICEGEAGSGAVTQWLRLEQSRDVEKGIA